MSREVTIVENVLRVNDELAGMIRRELSTRRIFTVNLIGAPGCGKTALLERTLKELSGQLRLAVMVGDLATARDAQRMAAFCDQVVQINTGKGCHLEANHVHQALSRIDLGRVDILFIENVGNLICPVAFDLGQDVKVGMFSVTEGDDKPAKHPYIVAESSVLILNKIDLLPYVPFKVENFRSDIARINPSVKIIELSAHTGEGVEPWLDWLRAKAKRG
jgi:hydrogenase nickel incorporation protein HypB